MPVGNTSTSARIVTPITARQYSVVRDSESCSQVKAAAALGLGERVGQEVADGSDRRGSVGGEVVGHA